MTIRNILFLFFAFLLNTDHVVAQGDFRKGYIITNVNDSIMGFVDYRTYKYAYKSCFFREANSRKKEMYKPDQIKAYGFIDGKRFVSRKINTTRGIKQIFIEQLVLGKMSLLRYKESYYVETDSLTYLPGGTKKFVNTESGTKIKTENKYIGLLNYFMFDCGLSANKTKYAEKSLTYLVQNYNRCKGNVGINYKEKLPWIKINVQVFSGFDMTDLHIHDVEANTFKTSTSPVLGASIDLSTPKYFDRLFFSINPFFTKKTFQGYNVYQNGSNSFTHIDNLINITHLKIPVGFRYNFTNEAQTPYIKGGLVKTFNAQSHWNVIIENESNGVVTTDYREFDFAKKSQAGYWASVGYSKILYRKFKGFVELRYEKSNGLISERLMYVFSSTTSINILMGLRF